MGTGDAGGLCRFCEIVSGAREACVVYENAGVLAFLDHRPLFLGHTLVMPRQHVETLADLPDDLLAPLFQAVRPLSKAVPQAMEAERAFVAINNRVSQSVPHLHVHGVPRRRGDGLRGFFWPRQKCRGPEGVAEVAARVRAAVEEQRGASVRCA